MIGTTLFPAEDQYKAAHKVLVDAGLFVYDTMQLNILLGQRPEYFRPDKIHVRL